MVQTELFKYLRGLDSAILRETAHEFYFLGCSVSDQNLYFFEEILENVLEQVTIYPWDDVSYINLSYEFDTYSEDGLLEMLVEVRVGRGAEQEVCCEPYFGELPNDVSRQVLDKFVSDLNVCFNSFALDGIYGKNEGIGIFISNAFRMGSQSWTAKRTVLERRAAMQEAFFYLN